MVFGADKMQTFTSDGLGESLASDAGDGQAYSMATSGFGEDLHDEMTESPAFAGSGFAGMDVEGWGSAGGWDIHSLEGAMQKRLGLSTKQTSQLMTGFVGVLVLLVIILSATNIMSDPTPPPPPPPPPQVTVVCEGADCTVCDGVDCGEHASCLQGSSEGYACACENGFGGLTMENHPTICAPLCDGTHVSIPAHTETTPAGSAVLAPNQQPNSTISFPCHAGYTSTAADNAVTYTCRSHDGVLGLFDLTGGGSCTEIICDGTSISMTTEKLAGSTAAMAAAQPFGSTLVFACPDEDSNEDQGYVRYVCGKDGFRVTENTCVLSGAGSCKEYCGANAFCSDTLEGYLCACNPGFSGPTVIGAPTTCLQRCDGTDVTGTEHTALVPSGTAEQARGQVPGSTLVFGCKEGFTGDLTYTCNGNVGQFQNAGNCHIISCDGTRVTASNAGDTVYGVLWASQAPNQAYGSTLAFPCEQGYTGTTSVLLSGLDNGAAQYTCDETGEFVATATCAPVGGGPVAVINPCDSVSCGSNSICVAIDEAAYLCACSQGYGGHTVSNGPATCGLLCDGRSVTTPSNADAQAAGSAVQRADQEPGSTLIFACHSGFVGSVTFTCGANGRFSTSDSCLPVTCDGSAIQQPANAAPLQSSLSASQAPGQPFNSHLTFPCIEGFIGTEVVYTCGTNGVFATEDSCSVDASVPAPTVCDGVYCGHPDRSICAEADPQTGASYICACSEGYGGHAVSDGPATCSPLCDGSGIIAPPHTNPQPTGSAVRQPDQEPLSTLIFSCSAGYVGEVVYTCGFLGSFVNSGSCAPLTCDGSAIAVPDNARPLQTSPHDPLAAQQQRDQPYNSHLVFPCQPDTDGVAVIYTCGQDGLFTTANACTRHDSVGSVASICDGVNCGRNGVCLPDPVSPVDEYMCACSTGYGGHTVRHGPATCGLLCDGNFVDIPPNGAFASYPHHCLGPNCNTFSKNLD